MEIKLLSGALGAEIKGIDLTDVSDENFKKVNDLLLEHKVIFFRDQPITKEQQIALAEKSSPLGDWTKYPECVRTKVCKLDKGQWTKELLGQRLDVLRRVRWCLCCGEVCQVRSDKDANWSDAEIIGDCHRKNTVKDNNGSAYPECNKTGVWESVKYTPQMKDIRRNEIRKLQREFAKRVASASGQRKKKSKKLK